MLALGRLRQAKSSALQKLGIDAYVLCLFPNISCMAVTEYG